MKQYTHFLGYEVQATEGKNAEGMLGYSIIHDDGAVSWLPKHSFENIYSSGLCDDVSFSNIHNSLVTGKRVRRKAWPDHWPYIEFKDNKLVVLIINTDRDSPGCFISYNITDEDLLADDWCVV